MFVFLHAATLRGFTGLRQVSDIFHSSFSLPQHGHALAIYCIFCTALVL